MKYLRLFYPPLLLFFLQFFTRQPVHAQAPGPYSPEVQERIRGVENNLVSWVRLDSSSNWSLHQRMNELHINGLSIAVIRNYAIEWVQHYGWADTAEKRPVTDQTLFQAASIGKSLHSAALLKLVAEGTVDLHADINTYLKSWTFPYDTVAKDKRISLQQMLSHTAGLGVHGFDGYKWGDSLPSLVQLLNGTRPANNGAVRSAFAPGTRFQYSGGGYQVSERLLEEVTGQPYAAFMEKNLFRPLGMSQTTYALKPEGNQSATAYRSDGKDIGCPYHLYPEKACGAGLWSTAADLARFVIGIQLSLRGGRGRLLQQDLAIQMLTPVAPSQNAGLGCFIDKKGAEVFFQHSGLNEGFSSQYWGSLQGGYGVVVLTNSDHTGFVEEVVNSVATVYGWKDFYASVSKKVISLPQSLLKTYAGKYRFNNGEEGPVILQESGHLYLKDPNSATKWRMYFTSEMEFFMLETPWANMQFFGDNKREVKGFYILGRDHREPVNRLR